MPITSTRHDAVKFVRTLARASVRRKERMYLAEGVRLVTEALDTGQAAALVLYDPAALIRSEAGSRLIERIPTWAERWYEAGGRVLEAAGETEAQPGILAVLRHPTGEPLDAHASDHFGVYLDGVADPGNVGTILRAADAFGADYAVAAPGTADLFAPKVVRAGMGAHFRLPTYDHLSWEVIRTALPNTILVGADADKGEAVQDFTWPARTGLVVGGEARGLSPQAVEVLDRYVHIPMRPGVESLNAAMAASILLFTASSSSTFSG